MSLDERAVDDPLETPEEICIKLKIEKTKFYELLKTKQLRAVKLGRLTRVARSERLRFQAGLPAFEPSGAASDGLRATRRLA